MKLKDNFYENVYDVVKKVPFGMVTTYGIIAEYLGAKKSSRLVGYAMNLSHNNIEIPAHRVVNRKGLLTGKHHFDGRDLMQKLLESEGHEIINNQIVNFEKVLWKPKHPSK